MRKMTCTNYKNPKFMYIVHTCICAGIFSSGLSEFLNVFILEIDSQADKVVIDGRDNFFKTVNFYENIKKKKSNVAKSKKIILG